MFAGIFYPDNATMLKELVHTALDEAALLDKSLRSGRPLAMLSPHAAFRYSCDVQAAAWSCAAGLQMNRVLIIAPLLRTEEHRAYLPEADIFQTPLGDIDVDTGACADLESCNTLFTVNDIPHFESHAIEVQLPFMKVLFPNALLVPILVAGDMLAVSSLSLAIDTVLGDDIDKTLIVASSNLASSRNHIDAAEDSDSMLRLMEQGDWKALCARKGGGAAIASVMATRGLQGASFNLLRHQNSIKQVSKADESIMHYAAAAWF